MTTPTPYVPFAPGQAGMVSMFQSVVQVIRANPIAIQSDGTASLTWSPLTALLDEVLGTPGLMRCRLDMQFIRRGIDQPAPMIVGRAPERVGVVYYLPAYDPLTGIPYVQAGDRLVCVKSPLNGLLVVTGTFEIRQVPDAALDVIGPHHVETQVVEVSQSLQAGSSTPFPGGTP